MTEQEKRVLNKFKHEFFTRDVIIRLYRLGRQHGRRQKDREINGYFCKRCGHRHKGDCATI